MKTEITEMIDGWVEPHREIGYKLRSIILEIDERITESIKWRSPVFTCQKNLCSIMPHSDHVNLRFFNGVGLSDPHEVLEGTGKSMRHLKIQDIEDIEENVIADLLREAVSLEDKHATRQ
ncbi:MAG TPA: DUF1801 domain-containing protein [bacterium]|nr:DUF1801 domain-containing protein [bacterium]